MHCYRYVKQDLLRNRLRLRPTDFLRPLLTDVKGRLNEQKLPPLQPTRIKELAECEEIWRPKKKRSSKYFGRKSSLKILRDIGKRSSKHASKPYKRRRCTATTNVEEHDREAAFPILPMSDLREVPELGDQDIDQLQTVLRTHFPDI